MKGISNKLQHLSSASSQTLACLAKSFFFLLSCVYRFLLLAHPLCLQIFYFVSLSFLGFWLLKALSPRNRIHSFTLTNLDLFFTSVSATTVSSMSTVEMEVFSNPQLIIMTILMFVGGEVFTSMVGLHFISFKFKTDQDKMASASSTSTLTSLNSINATVHQFELEMVTRPDPQTITIRPPRTITEVDNERPVSLLGGGGGYLRYLSIQYLGFVVLGYFLVVQVIGVGMVYLYLAFVSSAKEVLKNKGLKMFTFSVFTVVSTFASCGFVPTNENMLVFGKNSGLLLMLIPQVLLGNTLFPPCLRFSIWVLGKIFKRKECKYLLKNTQEVEYKHLLPRQYSILLVATVFGFILVQFILFCSLDWNSEALEGLNSYQKVIGITFQSVNSRHTGETIVDLSIISPAILVLFVVMMYLPPYTSFLPVKDDEGENGIRRKIRRGRVVENMILSQLSYLTIFIILVCITERRKLKEDPLNFSVLNIVVEVISAYGNVGFTTGYSCKRQLNGEGNCEDKWFGFVGRWSDEGKIILILVMFFGRLKKFNMDGGKPWKLL